MRCRQCALITGRDGIGKRSLLAQRFNRFGPSSIPSGRTFLFSSATSIIEYLTSTSGSQGICFAVDPCLLHSYTRHTLPPLGGPTSRGCAHIPRQSIWGVRTRREQFGYT